MPARCRQTCLDASCLVILLLAFGGSRVSLGLLQTNTQNGYFCNFFVTQSEARDDATFTYNIPTCKLALASTMISTICLATLTLTEIIRIVFQLKTRSFLCAKVLQIVLLTASIVCLAVTTAVVSAGWAMTCNTYNELKEDSPSFQLFSCTGYQYQKAPPHGGEIIAAAIFAGLTIPFLAVAIILFAARNRLETVRRHYQYTLQQQEPMDVIDTADPTAEDQ